MGLDMYLRSIPKVASIEELREIETRLSEAYFAGKKKFNSELKAIQEEKGFKNPIFYEVDEWIKTKAQYDKYNADEGHATKICLNKEVGYWRKFNALHKWFVDTFQDGEDDCGTYIVDIEMIKELLFKLATINKDNAKDILPPAEGFFFGSVELDEYYWSDIDELKIFIMSMIEENDFSEKSLVYYASW